MAWVLWGEGDECKGSGMANPLQGRYLLHLPRALLCILAGVHQLRTEVRRGAAAVLRLQCGQQQPHEAHTPPSRCRPETPATAPELAALQARGIPATESFSVRIDGLPAGLMPPLAFTAAPVGTAEQADVLAEQRFDEGELPQLQTASAPSSWRWRRWPSIARPPAKAACYSQKQQERDPAAG